jgi:hypothetical protein
LAQRIVMQRRQDAFDHKAIMDLLLVTIEADLCEPEASQVLFLLPEAKD